MISLNVLPMDSTFVAADAEPSFLVTDGQLQAGLLISRLKDGTYVVHYGSLNGSYRLTVDYLTWDAETETYDLQAETFGMPIRTLKLSASRKRTGRQSLSVDGVESHLLRRNLAEFGVDFLAPDGQKARIDPYASFIPSYHLRDLAIAAGDLRLAYRQSCEGTDTEPEKPGKPKSLPSWPERMSDLLEAINDIRLYGSGTVYGSSVVPNALVTAVEELAGWLMRLDQEDLDASTEFDRLLYARVGDLLRYCGINVHVLPAWGAEGRAVTGLAS